MYEDKNSLLMYSLEGYYNSNDHIRRVTKIIDQEDTISLRILDWFITNYSKKNRVFIGDFDVYHGYKLMLKSFSKKCFDPFCRKNKIDFYYTDDEYIVTSCGQLCFFRWCFQNNVIEYVENHLQEIEMDMKKCLSKSPSPDSRRRPLSQSASRSVSRKYVKYTIKFD